MTDEIVAAQDAAAKEEAIARAVVQAVSTRLDADVILFNSRIDDKAADDLHAVLEASPRIKKNVFVVLTTYGGDAHAAYVIGRDLQLRYNEGKVIICIGGPCYSAGTLIVLCAHELVIADRGRLGPLDVQLVKRDELGERVSGLTVSSAFDELPQKAFSTFVSFVHSLKTVYGQQITLKTSLDVAATITAGLFGEIYKQIDPLRVGQDAMNLKIAGHYGKMLGETSKNVQEGAIERLMKRYPSHECIIDREEAKELFASVRQPANDETQLLTLLGPLTTRVSRERAIIQLNNANEGGSDDDAGDGATQSGKGAVKHRVRGKYTGKQAVQGTDREAGSDSAAEGT